MADRLVAAHRRGVDVQVVLNGHSRQYKASRMLEDGIGRKLRNGSFVVFTRNSARGQDGFGVTHQKSWSFSRTRTAGHVSMIGSMNLSYASTKQYTDAWRVLSRGVRGPEA